MENNTLFSYKSKISSINSSFNKTTKNLELPLSPFLKTNAFSNYHLDRKAAFGAWMNKIDDELKLSELTIPGTHDSCATNIDSQFDIIKKLGITQSWSIEEQLAAGIRYLDIRLGNDGYVYHGSYSTFQKFDDILKTCQVFLKENTKETIIMRMKYEHGSKNKVDEEFLKYFTNMLDTNNKFIALIDHIPKLKEVRGKIWPIIEVHGYVKGFKWANNKAINLQDSYMLNTFKFSLYNKRILVKKFISEIKSKYELPINHLSVSGVLNFTYKVISLGYKNYETNIQAIAQNVNDVLIYHFGFLGTNVMDFPSENLVSHLIKQNGFIPKADKKTKYYISKLDEALKNGPFLEISQNILVIDFSQTPDLSYWIVEQFGEHVGIYNEFHQSYIIAENDNKFGLISAKKLKANGNQFNKHLFKLISKDGRIIFESALYGLMNQMRFHFRLV